jgi:anhydro-N-acetylmuramic acid kinase
MLFALMGILSYNQKRNNTSNRNLPEISSITQQVVVCDFRVQDVLMGGQGAPLVPIGDQILFQEYDYCMNLGGFQMFLMKKRKTHCLRYFSMNTVLNFYANKFRLNYDDKGSIERSGKINHNLLDELNRLRYYHTPKSLGFEFVKKPYCLLLKTSK